VTLLFGAASCGGSNGGTECELGAAEFVDCTADRPHSTQADRARSCTDAGYTELGECTASACETGYTLSGNECRPFCEPSSQVSEDCTNEILNAATASRTRTCNAGGSAYEDGACVVTVCEPGYVINGSSCMFQACTPNAVLGDVDCTADITGAAVAVKSRSCNSAGDGVVDGVCTLTSCLVGFKQRTSTCDYLGVSLTSGNDFTCAIRPDDTVVCWGIDNTLETVAPSGGFVDVSAGYNAACGIRSNGELACWGLMSNLMLPAGPFARLALGDSHGCALRPDGTVACWGTNTFGQTQAPTESFVEITATASDSCARRNDGTAVCWGYNSIFQPTGEFLTIGAHCGIRADRTISCWGSPYDTAAPTGQFLKVVTQYGFPGQRIGQACAIATDRTLHCWKAGSINYAAPPPGAFIELGVGGLDVCGTRTDGSVVCTGNQMTPPLDLQQPAM